MQMSFRVCIAKRKNRTDAVLGTVIVVETGGAPKISILPSWEPYSSQVFIKKAHRCRQTECEQTIDRIDIQCGHMGPVMQRP